MRWVSVEYNGNERCGLLQGERILFIAQDRLVDIVGDLEAAASRAGEGEEAVLGNVRLLSPIPRPRKILGIGVNYAAHAKESVTFITNDKPQVQKWFNKQATGANGAYDPVCLPKVSEQLDYEGELVVIIGKTGRHVPEARAMERVAGFAIGCDYSVRDWQRASPTMIMGKGFDTHAPFGPCLVTPDEVDDVSRLKISTFVNGELRQQAHAGDMTFSIAQQIAHLTAAFTLEPGDVIFTGTPAGVGAGHEPPKWLKAGDKVVVEISGLGRIENEIVPESGETILR
jgi:2-keto-4-pentenoate hydratase/2-oxohepta-3-ene-1,7-dioic acid hydratase in catechol pathway